MNEEEALASKYCGVYTDEQLETYVELLNTLYPWLSEWRLVRARKNHNDEFGDSVPKDEFYYKRSHGVPRDDQKLSRRSMDSLVLCLFNGNPGLVRLTKEFGQEIQERMQALMRNTLERFSPLATVVWPIRPEQKTQEGGHKSCQR